MPEDVESEGHGFESQSRQHFFTHEISVKMYSCLLAVKVSDVKCIYLSHATVASNKLIFKKLSIGFQLATLR